MEDENNSTRQIPDGLISDILSVLRSAPYYILLGTDYEAELGPDFKPHKYEGTELKAAQRAVSVYRELISAVGGPDIDAPINDPEDHAARRDEALEEKANNPERGRRL